jgi:hypothetical protein
MRRREIATSSTSEYEIDNKDDCQRHPADSLISPTTPQICKGYIIIKSIIKSKIYYEVFFFFLL